MNPPKETEFKHAFEKLSAILYFIISMLLLFIDWMIWFEGSEWSETILIVGLLCLAISMRYCRYFIKN